MKRSTYLLLKLAEEAGEVVVAAVKHRLHRTSKTRDALSREVGDFYAVAELLMMDGTISPKVAAAQRNDRYKREDERAGC